MPTDPNTAAQWVPTGSVTVRAPGKIHLYLAVGDLRARYANVVTVLVTAPPDLLRSRLAARERASDGRVSDRMRRLELSDAKLRPDVIIINVGDPESEARKLVNTFYASGVLA